MLIERFLCLTVLFVCTVYSRTPKLVCPKVYCPLDCPKAVDSNGCPFCDCEVATSCSKVRCPEGTRCEEVASGCDNVPKGVACDPVIEAKCVFNCPLVRCLPCESGYITDENGCSGCQCVDPCERAKCDTGNICVADSSLEERYKCVSNVDLCCPSPTPPRNCSSQFNVCQSCFRNCSTMRCGGRTRCCPDYFGCYGCRQAVPCSDLKN